MTLGHSISWAANNPRELEYLTINSNRQSLETFRQPNLNEILQGHEEEIWI